METIRRYKIRMNYEIMQIENAVADIENEMDNLKEIYDTFIGNDLNYSVDYTPYMELYALSQSVLRNLEILEEKLNNHLFFAVSHINDFITEIKILTVDKEELQRIIIKGQQVRQLFFTHCQDKIEKLSGVKYE